MRPEIDDTAWPLVRIRYRPALNMDDIQYLAERVEEIFRQRGPMVTVADIGELSLKATTAAHRRAVAADADRLAALNLFIAEAVVIPNPVLRVIYAGYVWARRRLNHPYACFAEESAALLWAQSCLRSSLIEPAARAQNERVE